MHYLILLDFHWTQLLQPKWYIDHGGLWFILFAVFAETGLFAGFFFPGDSLLFIAGIYAHEIKDPTTGIIGPGLSHEFLDLISLGAVQNEWLDLFILILLVSIAGIIGNTVGYWFGKRIGPAMFHWDDNFIFKKKYLNQAHDFYDKHGGGAIIFARFLPIIRTFAPIVAGIVEMDKKKFSYYNIVGCIAWVSIMILAGQFLQQWLWKQFHFDLKEHLEIIVLGIVLITTAPILAKLFFGKKKPSSDKTA
jgi:membrane-associated protein